MSAAQRARGLLFLVLTPENQCSSQWEAMFSVFLCNMIGKVTAPASLFWDSQWMQNVKTKEEVGTARSGAGAQASEFTKALLLSGAQAPDSMVSATPASQVQQTAMRQNRSPISPPSFISTSSEETKSMLCITQKQLLISPYSTTVTRIYYVAQTGLKILILHIHLLNARIRGKDHYVQNTSVLTPTEQSPKTLAQHTRPLYLAHSCCPGLS